MSTRNLLLLSFTMVALSAAVRAEDGRPADARGDRAPDALFRAAPPLAGQATGFSVPQPSETRLSNGARLWVVENHALPLVALRIAVPAGIEEEPPDHPGLSLVVIDALASATPNHTEEQNADRLALSGGHLTALSETWTWFAADAPKSGFRELLGLLGERLGRDSFSSEAIAHSTDKVETTISYFANRRSEAALGALFNQILFAGGPTTLDPEARMKGARSAPAAEVDQYFKRYFRPDRALIAVSGDITPAEARALLERSLARWKGKTAPLAASKPIALPEQRRVTLIDLSVFAGSNTITGGPGPAPLDVDSNAAALAVAVLDERLRKHGEQYPPAAFVKLLSWRERTALFFDSGFDNSINPVEWLEHRIQLVTRDPIDEAELALAKVRLAPKAASWITNAQVAEQLIALGMGGQTVRQAREAGNRLANTGLDAVNAAMRKYITPGRWPIVVLGAARNLETVTRSLNLGELEVTHPAFGDR